MELTVDCDSLTTRLHYLLITRLIYSEWRMNAQQKFKLCLFCLAASCMCPRIQGCRSATHPLISLFPDQSCSCISIPRYTLMFAIALYGKEPHEQTIWRSRAEYWLLPGHRVPATDDEAADDVQNRDAENGLIRLYQQSCRDISSPGR